MAINIKQITGHLLDKNPDNCNKDLWFDCFSKYLRLNIYGNVIWYYVNDGGIIVHKILLDKELEKLYKESNGFLEQLELF